MALYLLLHRCSPQSFPRSDMNLFYFSCDCRAAPERPANNMIADVFVRETTRSKAEARLKQHLENCGWQIKEVQHSELVQGLPVHDTRLSSLIKAARQNEIASEFSVY